MQLARQATLIGGHGFIGRHLLARLTREGWACWVPLRDDPQLWQRELGHVFYCAGLTADYAQRPFDTVEAHASLLNRVLRDARFESLVYLSSTRLYDGLEESPGEGDLTEDRSLHLSPDNPRHLYDLSKALGESLCRVAGQGRARVARLACVWSEGDDAEGFLPELLRRVRELRTADGAGPAPTPTPTQIVRVDSSPHFARDYVHIDDVLDALVALATSSGFGIYNVAGGCNVGNAALFERIGAAGGCEVVAGHDRTAPAPPRISIQRMTDAFDWRPADTLERVAQVLVGAPACSPS